METFALAESEYGDDRGQGWHGDALLFGLCEHQFTIHPCVWDLLDLLCILCIAAVTNIVNLPVLSVVSMYEGIVMETYTKILIQWL